MSGTTTFWCSARGCCMRICHHRRQIQCKSNSIYSCSRLSSSSMFHPINSFSLSACIRNVAYGCHAAVIVLLIVTWRPAELHIVNRCCNIWACPSSVTAVDLSCSSRPLSSLFPGYINIFTVNLFYARSQSAGSRPGVVARRF